MLPIVLHLPLRWGLGRRLNFKLNQHRPQTVFQAYRVHGPASRPRADKVQRRGQMVERSWQSGRMADKERTHGEEADTWRTQCGHMAARADKWQARFGGGAKADSGGALRKQRTQGERISDKVWRRGQSGIKADARRTMADTWRTSAEDAARAYRGQPFSKREPRSKLFGEKYISVDP